VWYRYETSGVIGASDGYDVGWGSQSSSILRYRLPYDLETGRVKAVETSGGLSTYKKFNYNYETGSDMVKQVVCGSFSRTHGWQSWRDVADSVVTTWGGTDKAVFTYNCNWMARRSDEKTTGPLVATLGSWTAPNGHAT
jgi:hypothetical protein